MYCILQRYSQITMVVFRNNAMHFLASQLLLKARLWSCPPIIEANAELNLTKAAKKVRQNKIQTTWTPVPVLIAWENKRHSTQKNTAYGWFPIPGQDPSTPRRIARNITAPATRDRSPDIFARCILVLEFARRTRHQVVDETVFYLHIERREQGQHLQCALIPHGLLVSLRSQCGSVFLYASLSCCRRVLCPPCEEQMPW